MGKKIIKGVGSFLTSTAPVRLVTFGYLSYILFGWALLCLSFSQRESVRSLDNLFTSVSAVSTTGLTTVSVSDHYTFFGQVVVICLIQLGGVGYMTLGSFVMLARGRDLSDLRTGVSKEVFSLPAGFRMDKFIRSVVLFTLVVEFLGAITLHAIFRAEGVKNPLWNGIFHSVSAFCTAGFSLFNNSMESFTDSFWLNIVIGLLSLFGAIGFIVLVDIWRRVTGKIPHITFTSNVILRMSLILLVIGGILILITEPSIRSKPHESCVMASFFQSMTAMTTVGFNSVPIGRLSSSTLVILMFLMIIGASPSGTGGGIKSTSFTAVVGVVRSALNGDPEVRFLGRVIPQTRVRSAMANVGFYLFVLLLGIFLLTLTEPLAFKDLLFEAASALGTVGLSTGITAALSGLGKVIVCALMFIGRLGPLTFAIALSTRPVVIDDDVEHDVVM